MMEYLTLGKQDPDFDAYLMGSFSGTHRALPVESYHVATPRERVTFRLVPLEKLSRPPWWMVYFLSCRPALMPLTLGPALAAWLEGQAGDGLKLVLVLAGLFFTHAAVMMFLDVQDHIHGGDRANRQRGSQVIQRGWVTAQAMKWWALLNLALALCVSAYILVQAPLALLGVCVGALVLMGGIAQGWGARFGICDLALVLLFGPLLTAGTALAVSGRVDITNLSLGLALGLMTLWVFQVRQLENLFRSKGATFRTFLGQLSFDRVKWVCLLEAGAIACAQGLVAWNLRGSWVTLMGLVLFAGPMVLASSRIFRAASPLSSSLVQMSRWAEISHVSLLVWWMVTLGVAWL